MTASLRQEKTGRIRFFLDRRNKQADERSASFCRLARQPRVSSTLGCCARFHFYYLLSFLKTIIKSANQYQKCHQAKVLNTVFIQLSQNSHYQNQTQPVTSAKVASILSLTFQHANALGNAECESISCHFYA